MPSEKSEIDRMLLDALRHVVDPLGKNMVDGGFLLEIKGEGESDLAVIGRDPGWMEPIRQRITREIQGKLRQAVPQLEKVRVEWRGAEPTPQEEAGPPKVKHVIAVGSGKG